MKRDYGEFTREPGPIGPGGVLGFIGVGVVMEGLRSMAWARAAADARARVVVIGRRVGAGV